MPLEQQLVVTTCFAACKWWSPLPFPEGGARLDNARSEAKVVDVAMYVDGDRSCGGALPRPRARSNDEIFPLRVRSTD